MWSRKCGQVPGVVVPKGPSDGSLAVYCQGIQETEPVSAEADMIGGRKKRSSTLNREHANRPTQTVPYGTRLFLTHSQAVNC